MGVEGKLVDLAVVLVQSSEFDTRPVQVIQDDLAIRCGSGNVRAELAMRPLYVVDPKAFTLSGM